MLCANDKCTYSAEDIQLTNLFIIYTFKPGDIKLKNGNKKLKKGDN